MVAQTLFLARSRVGQRVNYGLFSGRNEMWQDTPDARPAAFYVYEISHACKYGRVYVKEYKTYEHVEVILDLTVGLPGPVSCGVYVLASATPGQTL